MKKLGNVLAVIGILLVVYSIIEKYVGAPTINLGAVEIDAISGVTLANALMLIGLSLKLWDK